MANAIELEFNKYGCKLGDTIEVSLIGNHEIKVIFTITSDVINSGHFPMQLNAGDIIKCHVDHIDKSQIRIIKKGS